MSNVKELSIKALAYLNENREIVINEAENKETVIWKVGSPSGFSFKFADLMIHLLEKEVGKNE